MKATVDLSRTLFFYDFNQKCARIAEHVGLAWLSSMRERKVEGETSSVSTHRAAKATRRKALNLCYKRRHTEMNDILRQIYRSLNIKIIKKFTAEIHIEAAVRPRRERETRRSEV